MALMNIKQTPALGTWLGKVGKTLKNPSSGSYQALDLSDAKKVPLRAFYHSNTLSQHLLGRRTSLIQGLATKILPANMLEEVSAVVYDKLTALAKWWALYDMKKDERFGHLAHLSADERSDFADDLANQNRALAMLGAITGFLGLKGVVLDTAWLLLVALRSAYQLALVYQVPPTKDNTELICQLLAQMNLDKLQQKQILLTALALGDKMLINAQSTGLKEALSAFIANYPATNGYKKQFDELFEHIHLDKLETLTPNWLHHLLPLTAVVVGGYYNRELIDEVMGVAMATFAPKHAPLQLTQN